jgi:2-polyprenyl-3-methyl-5-hydroxy-6-metoxy-1,4-benzoquinol methylase
MVKKIEFYNMICDICGQKKTKILFPVVDRSYARTYTKKIPGNKLEIPDFNMVKCRACGHMYISPMPEQSFLDAFYTQYLGLEPDTDFYKDHFQTDYRNFEFSQKMKARCKKIRAIMAGDRPLRLCDVGCGTGVFLHIAKRYGFSVWGVEINKELADFAKKNFSVDVSCGRLEEIKFPSESFDVISLWDLIEHIAQPSRLLKEINRILKRGGLVAIETPNIDSLLHRLALFCYYGTFKKWTKPIDIYNVHHLHYLSPITIKKIIESYGFHIVSIDKDETNLSQWLGKDRDNVIKKNPILNLGLRFVFWLARLLRMQNKMIVYAIKD